MSSLKEQITGALRTVHDPDLKQDLFTLGMIQDLEVGPEMVAFRLVLTTPVCPFREYLKKACTEAIHSQVAAALTVSIKVDAQVTSSGGHTAVLPDVKNVIAIASGKGGVGKSTLAVHLALTLAREGARVGLLDADIFGPSLPTMLGCERTKLEVGRQADRDALIPLEKYGVQLISIGSLASSQEALVWRGPMASKAFRQLLCNAAWGMLDYLFIDLPPGTGDIPLTLAKTVPKAGVVIVTTPQKVALADATKCLNMCQKPGINLSVFGVVENMAYFTPPELPGSKYYIFGRGGGKDWAARHQMPFLGQIPLMQSIREEGDSGTVVVSKEVAKMFGEVASFLTQQIAIRNARFLSSSI